MRRLGLKVASLLLATLAQNATAGWRVAELNGAPGRFLDDRPVAPIMFWQWEAEEPDMKALAGAGVKLFGIFGSFGHYQNPYWGREGFNGMAVTHGVGLWYMDLKRDTFRDPELIAAVGRMRRAADLALTHDLREIYKASGVHVYTDEDVVLSANSAWLMLHTRKRGPYAVRLPRSVKTVRDVTSGAVVARDCDSFSCELEQFQTAVFLLVDQ